jgi:hypothetical protein
MLVLLVFAATYPPLGSDGPSPVSASGTTVNPVDRAPESAGPDERLRHRSGIVVGLDLGGGIGRGAGYPNNSNDVGKTDYSSSGWMPGSSGGLLVMGALADYLNFGFWFAEAGFRSGSQRASQVGIGLRVEAFPLVSLCPRLSGLGLFGQFGLGTAKLTAPGVPQVGGTQSYIGTGLFYEWSFGRFLGGHFGVGPSIEYDAVFTTPYDQNGLVASARLVFYGGP